MKKIIIASIISAIIFSSITAFAIASYNSDQVLYKKGNEDITVTEALDELYANSISTSTIEQIGTYSSKTNVNIANLYPNEYKNFTTNNFWYRDARNVVNYGRDPDPGQSRAIFNNTTLVYNSETGILEVNPGSGGEASTASWGHWAYATTSVYLIK